MATRTDSRSVSLQSHTPTPMGFSCGTQMHITVQSTTIAHAMALTSSSIRSTDFPEVHDCYSSASREATDTDASRHVRYCFLVIVALFLLYTNDPSISV